MLFTVIVVIAIVAAVLLGLVVLIQNPKGGGLTGSFAGTANQIFGYKRTTDDIEKITWGLIVVVVAMCLSSAAFKPSASTQQANSLAPDVKQPMSAPAPTPTQGTDEGAPIGADSSN